MILRKINDLRRVNRNQTRSKRIDKSVSGRNAVLRNEVWRKSKSHVSKFDLHQSLITNNINREDYVKKAKDISTKRKICSDSRWRYLRSTLKGIHLQNNDARCHCSAAWCDGQTLRKTKMPKLKNILILKLIRVH